MEKNSFSIEECKVQATLVSGDIITIPYRHMRYDSGDEIYWYKDQSLSNIKILDPQGNPQSKYKVFN